MKKYIGIFLVTITLFYTCACDPQTNESHTKIDWDENAQYAVAFLGYMLEDEDNVLNRYIGDFLPNLEPKDIPKFDATGDEMYLIVPRNATASITIYQCDMGESGIIKGDKLFDVPQGSPFVIKCNISDLYSNCCIEISEGEHTVTFSPYISLKDGTIIIGEQGQNITL